MNRIEEPVRSNAEGLGDYENDLSIEPMPPGVACLMPEYNDESSHERR